MKTIFAILFALVLTTGIILPANAQAANTIWIETARTSYQPGEQITVSLHSSSEVQVSGFNFQVRYDPTCLQYEGAAGALPGMSPFESNLPDLLDISFFGQMPQAANGTLADITFTALRDCQTTLSLESSDLLTLDNSGFAQSVPGVGRGAATISLNIETVTGTTPAGPLTPVSTSTQVFQAPIITISTPPDTIVPPVGTGSTETENSNISNGFPVNWASGFMVLALGMMTILAGLMILLLRRRPFPLPASIPMGGTPCLAIQHGLKAGQTYPLAKLPCRIGRGESNDVILPSQHLSRQHAQIYASHGAYYVADLGSKNGTFVNGKRLHNQSVPLRNGDQLKLGRDILAVFRLQIDLEMTV
jgi:hypothetical protein